MKHEVVHAPAFSALRLSFDAGESVVAQPGAMQAMTTGFDMTVRAGAQMGGKRGVMASARSLMGGESLFAVTYTAKREAQELLLAPEEMGEIRALEIGSEHRLTLARGSFLACETSVSFGLTNVGLRGLMAARGLFFLQTAGSGRLFLSSFGGVLERELGQDERFVIDNRNLVAFSSQMRFEPVVLSGSLRDSLLSGEGFVVRFTGPGTVLHQTRARPSLGLFRGLLQTVF